MRTSQAGFVSERARRIAVFVRSVQGGTRLPLRGNAAARKRQMGEARSRDDGTPLVSARAVAMFHSGKRVWVDIESDRVSTVSESADLRSEKEWQKLPGGSYWLIHGIC